MALDFQLHYLMFWTGRSILPENIYGFILLNLKGTRQLFKGKYNPYNRPLLQVRVVDVVVFCFPNLHKKRSTCTYETSLKPHEKVC